MADLPRLGHARSALLTFLPTCLLSGPAAI